MIKASLTSKGQITIPKEIREYLGLDTGDTVVFRIDESNTLVTFGKDIETIKCPMCFGHGEFTSHGSVGDKHETLKCPVCQSSGLIKTDISAFQEIANLMHVSMRYRIAVSLIQRDEDFTEKLIPEIKLSSKLYPQDTLILFQDYYQLRLIEECAPKSISEQAKFMNPSDSELDEILCLLQTTEAKETVKNWFRCHRNIFSFKNNSK